MLQILQDLKNGKTEVLDVPIPNISSNNVLIESSVSLVSAGTERMVVDFAKASYLNKAKKQPEKVRQVIEKVKTDGLISTYETISARLAELQPLGYSNVGHVVAIGDSVSQFRVGDRVVSNGRHAEVVSVPEKLVAKIPDEVSDSDASFTVITSIGLQGVRLLNPTLGESVVVIGLGLIGITVAQLLKANGCNVLGLDPNKERVKLALDLDINAKCSAISDPVDLVFSEFGKSGCDGVVITASTSNDNIIKQSAQMSRKRGRIILVGICDLNLDRSDFYEKELTFQVSCSYGPGRYDNDYEIKNHDYPLGFVRWTENRNFQASLKLMEQGKINFKGLVDKVFSINQAPQLYNEVVNGSILTGQIKYKESEAGNFDKFKKYSGQIKKDTSKSNIAVIGAGNFTKARILPALKEISNIPSVIVSSNGLSGASAAKKFQIPSNSTDSDQILSNKDIKSIFVTTTHDSHADYVIKALKNNKNVYVEKPLCLSLSELDNIIDIYYKSESHVSVGFNRRYAPSILDLKENLQQDSGAISINYNINAGYIPKEHWTQDIKLGGGRIIGECCHFIDLCQFLSSSKIIKVNCFGLDMNNDAQVSLNDNITISLLMENGSIANISYYSNGSKSYSKEKIEVFHNKKISLIDNFKKIKTYGYNTIKNKASFSFKQDKGHKQSIQSFIKYKNSLNKDHIAFADSVNSMAATFACIESLLQGKSITIDKKYLLLEDN